MGRGSTREWKSAGPRPGSEPRNTRAADPRSEARAVTNVQHGPFIGELDQIKGEETRRTGRTGSRGSPE